MNLPDPVETNERTGKREGNVSHADAANVGPGPDRSRLWSARIIWAVACVVAMLGWTSALAWAFWKLLGWLANLG